VWHLQRVHGLTHLLEHVDRVLKIVFREAATDIGDGARGLAL
jgi:hypothetical protein